MAFILSGGNVISFAEYSDVTDVDQRIFEANEGIADADMIEDLLAKSTNRILQMIKNTSWWRGYFLTEATQAQRVNAQTLTYPDVPLPTAAYILNRKSDFTDLCVYHTMFEYLLPKIADYSAQDNAEVVKVGVYRTKFERLFDELIQDGSWYDFDNSGQVTSNEKMPTRVNLVRVR